MREESQTAFFKRRFYFSTILRRSLSEMSRCLKKKLSLIVNTCVSSLEKIEQLKREENGRNFAFRSHFSWLN